jgi:hypothetical protein
LTLIHLLFSVTIAALAITSLALYDRSREEVDGNRWFIRYTAVCFLAMALVVGESYMRFGVKSAIQAVAEVEAVRS